MKSLAMNREILSNGIICSMMKRLFTVLMAAVTVLAACQKEDILQVDGDQNPVSVIASKTFRAIAENTETKAYFDGTRMVWNNGDWVTIYAGRDVKETYRVSSANEDGSTSVTLKSNSPFFDYNGDGRIDSNDGYSEKELNDYAASLKSGNPISANVAVYPSYYGNRSTITENDGVFSLDINLDYSCEDYDPVSDCFEDVPMIAVTNGANDTDLYFKNLYGFLKIPIKGEDSELWMVTVKGNNGEKISGRATVTCSHDGDPAIEFAQEAIDSATFYVDAMMTDDYRDFYFPLPPMTFSKGVTVTLVGIQGDKIVELEKKTSSEVIINRSMVRSMKGVDYGISPTVMTYKTTDETVLEPTRLVAKDKNGQNLTYTNEYRYDENWGEYKGFITVNGIAKSMDLSWAAPESGSTLTEFEIDGEFTENETIVIESLEGMFENCNNLQDVDLDDFDCKYVTSTARMFKNCSKFNSAATLWRMNLSNVTDMSETFSGCTSLSSIWMKGGEKVKNMDKMFYNCSNLYSIDLADMNLISLESSVLMLDGCVSLEEITVGAENGKSAIKPSTFGEYDESQHRYISAGIKKGGTLRTTQSVGMSGLFYGWMLPCFDFSWNLILE